ncbi:peptidoglycan editing factor PgeF [bacterium]|nr:peptidoglycan editing factor PgeF [bacterium]
MMTPILASRLLSEYNEKITHGFTTRFIGDDTHQIEHFSGITADQIFGVKQIHSNKAIRLSPTNPGSKPEADALVTEQFGQYISIRTADCVPILLYDPVSHQVGAVHAGWRGLIAGVLENTLKEMAILGTQNSNLLAAVGPFICKNCFEVGEEVVEEFIKKFGTTFKIYPGEGKKSFIDLGAGIQKILEESGVPKSQIEFLPFCTRCHNDLFFSYRNGDIQMRNLSFIGLK